MHRKIDINFKSTFNIPKPVTLSEKKMPERSPKRQRGSTIRASRNKAKGFQTAEPESRPKIYPKASFNTLDLQTLPSIDEGKKPI